jgi:hypothetical protein
MRAWRSCHNGEQCYRCKWCSNSCERIRPRKMQRGPAVLPHALSLQKCGGFAGNVIHKVSRSDWVNIHLHPHQCQRGEQQLLSCTPALTGKGLPPAPGHHVDCQTDPLPIRLRKSSQCPHPVLALGGPTSVQLAGIGPAHSERSNPDRCQPAGVEAGFAQPSCQCSSDGFVTT